VGHGCLDVLDSRGSGVFARFGVVVVEVWGAVRAVRRVLGGGGKTYSVSSGRDMMAVGFCRSR